MGDILADIREQLDIIDTCVELDEEKPTERLKNWLLDNLDNSQTPDEIRNYILMNLDGFDLSEFWKWVNEVKEYQISIDPRFQQKNFLQKISSLL